MGDCAAALCCHSTFLSFIPEFREIKIKNLSHFPPDDTVFFYLYIRNHSVHYTFARTRTHTHYNNRQTNLKFKLFWLWTIQTKPKIVLPMVKGLGLVRKSVENLKNSIVHFFVSFPFCQINGMDSLTATYPKHNLRLNSTPFFHSHLTTSDTASGEQRVKIGL